MTASLQCFVINSNVLIVLFPQASSTDNLSTLNCTIFCSLSQPLRLCVY